jgi:hypothetical protein
VGPSRCIVQLVQAHREHLLESGSSTAAAADEQARRFPHETRGKGETVAEA